MDWSLGLSIVGVVLTVVSLFTTVNKTNIHTRNKNSNNRNVSNSFNRVTNNFHQDNRVSNKTYQTNHYHTHHHNTSPTNASSNSNDSDQIFWVLIMAFLGAIVLGGLLFVFVNYKLQIQIGIAITAIIGLFISTIVSTKRHLELRNKLFLIFCWIPVFVVLILVDFPFFSSKNVEHVVNVFSHTKILDAPVQFVKMEAKYRTEQFFLIFQMLGLAGLAVMIISNAIFVYRTIRNRKEQENIKNFVTGDIFIFVICFLLVSGLAAKLVS